MARRDGRDPRTRRGPRPRRGGVVPPLGEGVDTEPEVIGDLEDEFIEDLVEFALSYAAAVRRDHALFVDAFRDGDIAGLSAT